MKNLSEKASYKTHWRIEKFADDLAAKENRAFETVDIDGNLLLNEGINELLTAACGTGATKFDNANAYLGVGDSSTAENAAQTGLQAASNKTYKPMNASYPTYGTSQKVTFQADFGSADANYAWNEFTVANGNSDTAKNLNRKVSAQGTKTAGQTWRLTLDITLS